MLTTAKQTSGFLGTMHYSSKSSCASLQITREYYKTDFDQRLCKGRESITTGNYVLIIVSDVVTKTPKFGDVVEELYLVLG